MEDERARGYLQWLLLDQLVTSRARPTVQELLEVFETAGKALDLEGAEAALVELHETGAIERGGERIWATKTAIHVMGLPDASAR